MKYNLTTVFIASFLALNTFGQTNFPIKLAVSNETTAIPFTMFFTTPVHPTIQIGTEYYYKIGYKHNFYQTASIGYIFHNHLYQGVYINSGIGYDYKLNFGLKLKSNLEVGYLHTFTTQDEYQFENGEYVNGKDKGNSRVMPMLSVGFGFVFKKNKKVKSELYTLYKSWIEYPYSSDFIPTMAHINFELGYLIYLN